MRGTGGTPFVQSGAPATGSPSYALLADAYPDASRGDDVKATFSGITYTRAAVALRFDDINTPDYTASTGSFTGIYPALKARGLCGGFAAPTGYLDTAGKLTTAQLLEVAGWGNEVMAHSRTHGADPVSYAAFTDETITAAAELAAKGFHVDNFVQPGTWVAGYNFDTDADFAAVPGRDLRRQFAAVEAYLTDDVLPIGSSQIWPLPRRRRYGVGHYTLETSTLANAKLCIDYAIQYGAGVEFLLHSFQLDVAGKMTSADFLALLDYIQTKRDAGLIDVVTPTGLLYATKADTPVNQLGDPDFALSATGAFSPSWTVTQGSPTVIPGAGRNGAGAVQINYTNNLEQRFYAKDFRTLRFEGWVKTATPGSSATPRVLGRFYDGASTNWVDADVIFTAVTDTWTKYSFHVRNHPSALYFKLWLYHTNSGADLLWSDLSLRKV